MPNTILTPEDVAPLVDEFASANSGFIDLILIFDRLKKTMPKARFTDFSRLARERSNQQGYKIGLPPVEKPKPLMPRSPSQESEKATPDFQPQTPSITFADVGGLDFQKSQIIDLIKPPMEKPFLFESVHAHPIRGILLHGPSGCGKTLLAEAAAGEFSARTFFKVSAPELMTATPGQSENKVRALFNAATSYPHSIVFIDDIDAIMPSKDASRDMERRMVFQLKNSMDTALGNPENDVVVIAATNKLEKVDPILRMPGRFTREIAIGIPDYAQRVQILKVISSKVVLNENVNIESIARMAEGYVGVDLYSLVQEAALISVKRASDADETSTYVSLEDLEKALKIVLPSLRREGFATLPPAQFSDIGGLEKVKEELQMAIVNAIIHPEIYDYYGHRPASGVILYGPPGCGKTLLARAVAHEADRAAFINVKGPELLSKYLGESESAVRGVFRRARDSAPCIIFFDEIDAICPRRSDDSSNAAASRVVNQLLTEMDGAIDRGRVFVIGATNRLELIDEAMLRPGRLDKKIEVPLPGRDGRADILIRQLKKIKNCGEVDVGTIADMTEGFSGADINSLITEAIELAIQQSREGNWVSVSQDHLVAAANKVIPQVKKAKTRTQK